MRKLKRCVHPAILVLPMMLLSLYQCNPGSEDIYDRIMAEIEGILI